VDPKQQALIVAHMAIVGQKLFDNQHLGSVGSTESKEVLCSVYGKVIW
jgi:hypothetical protein